MAAPTSTVVYEPNYYNDVSGSNVDAGDNDYDIPIHKYKAFSIVTGTLTAMTVTVLAYNKTPSEAVDITSDLWTGVSALSSDESYAFTSPLPWKNIIVRAARSNATNAVALTIYALKNQ